MKFLDINGVKTLWDKLIPVNKIKVKLNLSYDESTIDAITTYISNNINADVNNFSESVLNYIIFTVEFRDKLKTIGHVLLHVEKDTANVNNENSAGGVGLIMNGYTNPNLDEHTIGFGASSLYNIYVDTSITGQNTTITKIS